MVSTFFFSGRRGGLQPLHATETGDKRRPDGSRGSNQALPYFYGVHN